MGKQILENRIANYQSERSAHGGKGDLGDSTYVGIGAAREVFKKQ
jgi:hypothetical protein